MSKKFINKQNNKPSWKNQYNEHDFRTSERRVSFKHNNKFNQHKAKNTDWSNSIRAHLHDEDIDMGNFTAGPSKSDNKFSRRGNRSGSPAPRQMKRKLWRGPVDWYRVTLPYGNKYEKKFMQQTLLEKVSPLPFIPIAWKANGNAVSFYVDDLHVAEKLHVLDYTLQMPDGFKLMIKVQYGSPNVDITTEMKEKMKLAMAGRYNAVNKALDLTKFHVDPILEDYFCALYKPIILLAVIDIIGENIPELEALSLNDNKLQILTVLKKYVDKLKNVKILHLGENKIRQIAMLDSLIGLPLEEIVLEGNPLCETFKDKDVYISEVRSRFPKIMKLDNQELPPPISFDLVEEHTLPTPLQTFLCNVDGGSVVRQFVEQYFQLYDSDNREMLMQAYHENALFSMTMAYPYGTKMKTANWLNWYATDNRDLLKVTDPDRRLRLLKKGNISIISFLKEMPATSHDILNFKVDLSVCTPIMMSLTVSGLFKEANTKGGHKRQPIRSFFRTLIIVPAGTGYCISNEQLHITNATEDQIKTFQTTPIPAVIVAAAAASPPPVVAPVVPNPMPSSIDDTTKQQMVEALSSHSGMNLEWSAKCLLETEWNFERATTIFNQLHSQGAIPSLAFVK